MPPRSSTKIVQQLTCGRHTSSFHAQKAWEGKDEPCSELRPFSTTAQASEDQGWEIWRGLESVPEGWGPHEFQEEVCCNPRASLGTQCNGRPQYHLDIFWNKRRFGVLVKVAFPVLGDTAKTTSKINSSCLKVSLMKALRYGILFMCSGVTSFSSFIVDRISL